MCPIRGVSRFQVQQALPPAIADNRSPRFPVPESKRSKPQKKPGLAGSVTVPTQEPLNRAEKVQPFRPQPAVALVEEGKAALVKPVEIASKPTVLLPDQPNETNGEAVDPPQGQA